MEALTLAAIHYESFSRCFLDKGAPSSRDPSKTAKSPFEVLSRIHSDNRPDSFTKTPGRERLEPLLANYESVILEYWRGFWPITNPTEQFREALDVSVALLVGTKKPSQPFDFLTLHTLTACHAALQQWWLFAIVVYIVQVRPETRDDTIADYDLKGWWGLAVDSKATLDAHYVKAIRAIKEASKFGHKEQDWYLKAAGRFAAEFEYYGGFGEIDGAIIDQLMALMQQPAPDKEA